jgi:hypothetical protein
MLWVFCFLPLDLARKEKACNGVPGEKMSLTYFFSFLFVVEIGSVTNNGP